MNKTVTLIAAGLAACAPKTPEIGSNPVDVEPPTSLNDGSIDSEEFASAQQAASEALETLAGLELVVVGQLIVDAPESDTNCYGPCFDDPVTQTWLQEHARQVARLEVFVDHAVEARANPAPESASFDETEALAKLGALEIVDVEAIDWEQGGSCYTSMCESDMPRRAAIERLIASTEGM